MSNRNIPVDDIRCRQRVRKDMGNIDVLAESIATVGLLHPIVVNSDLQLIAGERRLKAFKKLRRDTIPARVVKT